MNLLDFLIVGALVVWLVGAIALIVQKKNKGECIGCSGGNCAACGKKHRV